MARGLRPLFVTVTWGAGGSTAEGSLQLAEVCQSVLGLTTCLHLTCTNMKRSVIDNALETAKAAGIRNILALRGDPPREDEYLETPYGDTAPASEFTYAIDLVKYIREKYGDWFCIGVAAYPEGHAEGTAPYNQSVEHDLPYLVEKVQAGADFIMTQLFYDVSEYIKFERTLREHPSGAFKTLPVIPGLMPIQSYQILKRTTKLSHAKVPQKIMDRLDSLRGDDEAVKSAGVDILCDIIRDIKDETSSFPRGFHFFTLNLEKAVAFVLERSNLIPPDEHAISEGPSLLAVNGSGFTPIRRSASVVSDTHNRVIVDGTRPTIRYLEAPANSINIEPSLAQDVTLAVSEGEGTLGREATWDDFPNGRFGDPRSPAFGEIDGYGPSLHVSRAEALKLWGYPVSRSDISTLFIRHIQGELTAIPWSEAELNEESKFIRDHLINLDKKGWWTVASQPAVNGVPSNHQTFGWGPKGGFVFQKAFVEMFIPRKEWEVLKEKLDRDEEVTYYASRGRKEEKLVTSESSEESVNAVTWGCFPSKE